MTDGRRRGGRLASLGFPGGALALLAACVLLLGASGIAAQASGNIVSGRVTAAGTGAGVGGAQVQLVGPVEETVFTAPDGTWRADGIPAGQYLLSVLHLAYVPTEVSATVGSVGTAAETSVEIALTPRPVVLDELVVTSSRRLQRLGESVIATELVSRSEILETGASDLASVLTERTGLELQGGHPAGSGVMIQGMGSERVLILVDGQPFIGRLSGQVDVSRLPTSMIERIEVVKGPQSTLYGSEAMGGVVNVITRRPDASWSSDMHITAGAQRRLDLGAALAGGAEALRGTVAIGRRSIDRTPGLGEGGSQLAARWDGSFDIEWRTPVQGLLVEGGSLLLDESQRWSSGQIFRFADNQQWTGRLGIDWTFGAQRLTAISYATAFHHLARSATGPRPVEGTGERETQSLRSAEVLYSTSFGAHTADVGLEGEEEEIRSDRVAAGTRASRTLEGFAQISLSFGRVTVLPGVRATQSEPWGTHWTPRLGIRVTPAAGWTLRVSTGEGFRAPDFKERYMEFLNVGPGFGYTVRGNPELGPEVSRNVTAGVERAGNRTYLRAQVFHNAFEDFIETQAVGDSSGITVYTYGNIDDGVTSGVELELGVTHGGWRMELGRSWLHAEQGDSGETLLGRPRSSTRALVSYAHPVGSRVSMTAIHTGRTAMERTDTGTEWRDDFSRLDLRVAQELPGGVAIMVGVDNVFDTHRDRWPGFTERHLYTTVSWLPFDN